MRATRPRVDPRWLDRQLTHLDALAAEGDMLGVVGHLTAMVNEPRRESAPADVPAPR